MKDKDVLNKIRKLIKKEEKEAFDTFIKSDVFSILQKRIRTQSQQKNDFKTFKKPAFVLSMIFLVIIGGTIILMIAPYLSHQKSDRDRIKKIFYAASDSRFKANKYKTPILYMSEEEIHCHELTWLFKNAQYNLFPRELSKQELRNIFLRAFTLQPGNEKENSSFFRGNADHLNLEQRLKDLLKKKKINKVLNKLSEYPEEV